MTDKQSRSIMQSMGQTVDPFHQFELSNYGHDNQIDVNFGVRESRQQNADQQQKRYLINELQALLAHEDVRTNMSYALNQRVQKVMSAFAHPHTQIKGNSTHQRKALGQIYHNNANYNSNNRINSFRQQINTKPIRHLNSHQSKYQFEDNEQYQPLFSEVSHPHTKQPKLHYYTQSKQNHTEALPQEFQQVLFNIKKCKTINNHNNKQSSKSKQKQSKNTLRNTKNYKQICAPMLKTPSKSKLKMKTDIISIKNVPKMKRSNSKQKQVKCRKNQDDGKKFKSKDGNNTVKKQRNNLSNQIRSVSVTAYTTRNNENSKQIVKNSHKRLINNGKDKQRLKSAGSAEKLNFITAINSIQIKNNMAKLIRNQTQQTLEQTQIDFLHSNQRMRKANQKTPIIQETKQQKQINPIQFIARIKQLQQNAQNQQQQLQTKVKFLKSQLNAEKSVLQQINYSIQIIKQEIRNININKTFLTNKKKQNRNKLEHVWFQVKNLNAALSESNSQNSQFVGNLQQQKQLIHMYNTVIEQLKSQLKIEIQERDTLKKELKQSKKSEQAFKLRATSTKERTELMLSNVKDSISKWAI